MVASIMGVLDQRFYGSPSETMLLQASTKKAQWEPRCKARGGGQADTENGKATGQAQLFRGNCLMVK